jgi:hypothetical protein
MTEEIKEIIDYLIDEECTRRIKCITIEESKKLLDYITNLQQENEKEKQFIKDCGFQNQQQLVLAYLDYKSRCEKAKEELSYMSTDAYTDNYDIRDKCYNLLMNILNGVDEQ